MAKARFVGFGIALLVLGSGILGLVSGNIGTGLFSVGASLILLYSIKVSDRDDPVAGAIAFVVLILLLGVSAGLVGVVIPADFGGVVDSGESTSDTQSKDEYRVTDEVNSESRDSSGYGGDSDCDDFSSQAAARDVYEQSGGAHGLDGDGDGVACEHLP